MKYDALEVAHYILTYCFNAGSPISNLRLQKMLYFVQGEFYKITGEPLFENDISAWQFGPVVPDVYYEYSIYAGTPILETYPTSINFNDMSIINNVIKKLTSVPTWKLVDITHKKGTPWYKVFNEDGNRFPIDKKLLCKYFYNNEEIV